MRFISTYVAQCAGFAASGRTSNTLAIPEGAVPDEWVKTAVRRVADDALRFEVTGSNAAAAVVSLKPLNEVVEERYTVYYNLTSPK